MSAHHPPEELLLDHAAGNLPELAALAIATHAASCADCRGALGRLEQFGASLLEALPASPVSSGLLDRVFAAIDAPVEVAVSERREIDYPAFVPPVLRPHLPNGWAKLRWRTLAPGLEAARLKARAGLSAFLLRIAPGGVFARHGHGGLEYTAVLTGGYRDGDMAFGAGDFAVRDGGDTHEPVADPDEPCISLVVLEGGLEFETE